MTQKRAIALGFFDGIHIGHAALLRQLSKVCVNTDLTPMVISFDKLPQNVLTGSNTPLINTMQERSFLISRYIKADEVYYLPFNKKVADMPWENFIDMLINRYDAKHLIAGEDFKFGKDAEGNSEHLIYKCKKSGIGCDIIPEVMLDGIVISSTYIRDLLQAGNIERANRFLGHPHIITGVVEKGQKFGTKLGTPTINIKIHPDVLTPAHGVYATKVYEAQGNGPHALPAVTNIGMRPTVDTSGTVTVETHIPGFDKDIYGRKICIELHGHLRDEKKFANTEELKKQIQDDCAAAAEWFKNNLQSKK